MIDTLTGRTYHVSHPLTALHTAALMDELRPQVSISDQEFTLDLAAVQEADITGINLLVKINLLALTSHSKLLVLLTKGSQLDELLHLTKISDRIMLVYTAGWR